MNTIQSGYVFKMFPSVSLVKKVENDGAVAVLELVVTFVDAVAVLAAELVTPGVGALLEELVVSLEGFGCFRWCSCP
jgi:hypothetical protein